MFAQDPSDFFRCLRVVGKMGVGGFDILFAQRVRVLGIFDRDNSVCRDIVFQRFSSANDRMSLHMSCEGQGVGRQQERTVGTKKVNAGGESFMDLVDENMWVVLDQMVERDDTILGLMN